MFTPVGKFKDSRFSCFNFFLFTNTRLESLQQLSFKITLLGETFEGIRWQSSTKSVLTGTSIASRTSSTFFTVYLFHTSAGMPDISRHCFLEYCSLAWHFRSRTTILSGSLSFIFLEMCRSDSILKKLVFSSFRLFFSSSKMLLNFPWQSSIILTKSSLFKRIRDDSIWDIFQVVKAQVQLSTTEKTADVSLRLTYLFSLRRSAGLTSGASFDEGYIGINIFQFFFLSGFCFTNIYESQDCKGNGGKFH